MGLDTLARELVLNAGPVGSRSLTTWDNLATAINHIKRLDEVASALGRPDEILLELHRIAHRQFPWQTQMRINPIIRVLKIFGRTAVESIVARELGMNTRQFIHLGLALVGHFQRQFGMSTNQDYSVLGISKDASSTYLSRITSTLEILKR